MNRLLSNVFQQQGFSYIDIILYLIAHLAFGLAGEHDQRGVVSSAFLALYIKIPQVIYVFYFLTISYDCRKFKLQFQEMPLDNT